MRNLIRALAATLLLATLPLVAEAALFVSVAVGPPALPVYTPPPVPGPGYMWAPGYWAWGGGGYYWVPGTWVLPPAPGLLWTPGYWGWTAGVYAWHPGYWGQHVGFYGGINYGYGYRGDGYHGGYWRGNEYIVNRTVINEAPVNRVSFNGGAGGVVAHATPAEMRAAREQHMGMSSVQQQHEQLASRDKTLFASYNHGSPPVAATQKPGVFYGHGVVAAHSAGAPAPSAHVPAAPHAWAAAHPVMPGAHGGGEPPAAHAQAPAHPAAPAYAAHLASPAHPAAPAYAAHPAASPASPARPAYQARDGYPAGARPGAPAHAAEGPHAAAAAPREPQARGGERPEHGGAGRGGGHGHPL